MLASTPSSRSAAVLHHVECRSLLSMKIGRGSRSSIMDASASPSVMECIQPWQSRRGASRCASSCAAVAIVRRMSARSTQNSMLILVRDEPKKSRCMCLFALVLRCMVSYVDPRLTRL